MWNWILKPIVVVIAGGAGVAALKESPIAGIIFIGISLAALVVTFS